MTPFSLVTNNSNKFSSRKNEIKELTDHTYASPYIDQSLNAQQDTTLCNWSLKDGYCKFTIKNQQVSKSISILQSKVEAFLPLLKNFIICVIDCSRFSTLSSADLLLEVLFLVKEPHLINIFVLLCKSNFAKKLIGIKQNSLKEIHIAQSATCASSTLLLVIHSLLKINLYVQDRVNLKDLEKISPASNFLKRSFSKAALKIFKLECIESEELKELTNIILENSNPQGITITAKEHSSFVNEAIQRVQCAMQFFVNQVCYYLVNANIAPPYDGKRIFSEINKILKLDLCSIEPIIPLDIWNVLILRFFNKNMSIIKNQPIKPKLISICSENVNFEQAHLLSTLDLDNKHEYLSPLNISCRALIKSFQCLKKILYISYTIEIKKYDSIQHNELLEKMKISFFSYLSINEMKDVLVAALPQHYSNENINSETQIVQNESHSTEEEKIQIPKRRSKIRSRIERTLYKKTKNDLKNQIQQEIIQLTSSTRKRTSSEIEQFEFPELYFPIHFNSILFLDKLEETINLLEYTISSALSILIFCEIDNINLSPAELVETAMTLTILLSFEGDDENTKSKKFEKMTLALIQCQESIPKELLKKGIAWGTLASIRYRNLNEKFLNEEQVASNYQFNELSNDLTSCVSLLVMNFRELLYMLKTEETYFLIQESSMMFFNKIAKHLKINSKTGLRRKILLNTLIQYNKDSKELKYESCELKDALCTDLQKFDLVEIINSSTLTNQNYELFFDEEKNSAPNRKSKRRSITKTTSFSEEKLATSQIKQYISINTSKKSTEWNCAFIFDSILFLAKLEETLDLIDNIISFSISILTLYETDQINLSPSELVKTAIELIVLVPCEKPAMDHVMTAGSIIEKILKTEIVWAALSFIRAINCTEESIIEKQSLAKNQFHELSNNLNESLTLLSIRFKELRLMLKEEANIHESSIESHQFTIFLNSMIISLNLHTKMKLRIKMLISAIIQSLLQNPNEE